MAREHLTLFDLSDREFLLILDETGDGDGWADSLQIAARLDLSTRYSASSRLSWAARNGLVEREAKRDHTGAIKTHRDGRVMHTQRWRLTEIGRAYAYGRLKARQREALDRLDDAAMLEATQLIGERAQRDPATRWLLGRQWRHTMGR